MTETLNIKLSELILNGPEENLKKTEITQPAILTTSYAIFEVIKKEINIDQKNFKFFAGHSLGEYSALVSSGSLKFEDALKLVHQRGKFMQSAVPEGEGAMLAVMGVDIKSLVKFLEELAANNTKVSIPLITDPRGVDLNYYRPLGQTEEMAEIERRFIKACEKMNILMTNTCVNYQTIMPPLLGEHTAYET